MRTKYVALFLIIVLVIVFAKPLVSHAKILLLISEEFPQIPFKPLKSLTSPPLHQEIELDSAGGKIKADLFIPKEEGLKPALILAMAVKTAEKDRAVVLGFAETMSRLGYVVIWPRLKVLDEGISTFEEPETFVKSFQYLEDLKEIDRQRISFVGFSAGSSVAFVAVTDPQINDKVRGLVFFGGYADIFDYLESLVTKKSTFENATIDWQPAEGAVSHTVEVLTTKNAKGILRALETKTAAEFRNLLGSVSEEELSLLKQISPREFIDNFKARIFILHDKNDPYVPYFESAKLSQYLPADIKRTYSLVNLFEHVQPKSGLSLEVMAEFIKLYGFLYETIAYL